MNEAHRVNAHSGDCIQLSKMQIQITASMRRGMEAISLWHCSGVMEAQVALIAAFR